MLAVLWVNVIPPGFSVLDGLLKASYRVGEATLPEGPFTLTAEEPKMRFHSGNLTLSLLIFAIHPGSIHSHRPVSQPPFTATIHDHFDSHLSTAHSQHHSGLNASILAV